MRLALQALFGACDDDTEEGRKRSERIERDLRGNGRSRLYLKKLNEAISDPGLKAPEIFAKESFPDANVVAEYLDCQSESDEVLKEYERVCLESPEILAEIGCCYDVLTNRLGRPTNAPKNCKRRLYHVAWEESVDEKYESLPDCAEDKQGDLSGVERRVDVNVVAENPDYSTSPRESDVQEGSRSARKPTRRTVRLLGRFVFAAVLFFGIVRGVSYLLNVRGSQTVELTDIRERTNQTATGVEDKSFVAQETLRETESKVFSDFITEDSDSYSDAYILGEKYDDSVYADGASEKDSFSAPSTKRRSDGFEAQPTSALDESEYALYASSAVSRTRRAKRGLAAPDMKLNEGIVIPERNNDVFAKATRF